MDKSLRIKYLSEEDRPREKLLQKGRSALSKAELLAILLGSGNAKMNAIELAQHILNHCQNDLNHLARLNVNELTQFNGIGHAKAITIISALELGRRRKDSNTQQTKITSANDAFQELKPHFLDLPHEEFWSISLNRANHVIAKNQHSTGGIAGTVADPKLIFKKALENNASSIIVAHNHPSGNLTPSESDIFLTDKLRLVGKNLDLPVLDHLIISDHKFYSFADNGLI